MLDKLTPAESTPWDTIDVARARPTHNKGMIAAADPRAVEAGLTALRAGGSAVDAAIAVQAVLGLVEPESSGIGGGAFMVFYDAKAGKVFSYNGRETAPSAIDEDMFAIQAGEATCRFPNIASGCATGVPGVIAMLHLAYEDYGTRPWAENFKPAIELAETGFAVSPRMADLVANFGEDGLKLQKEAREYYFHQDGSPIEIGFVRDNKPYAQTLRAISRDYRSLYEGPIAEAIIATINEKPRPGKLTLDDIKKYKPSRTGALCSSYREFSICGAPPPSSGGVAVQSILGQLANFDMKSLGPNLLGWHVFAEASELAYADRDLYVADPDHVAVPTKSLLDPDYLKSRATLISMEYALKNVKAGKLPGFEPGIDATPDNPGTSHFSIVDRFGNVVSMTSSVEAPFGSKRMVGGFMLNNHLMDFSFSSKDDYGQLVANRPEGRKRPRSSMAPHIVFDANGEFLFATGSPGGSSIIAYTAQTIVAMIDWGLRPQEAADLANVISRNGSLRLEERSLPLELIQGLMDLGHKVVRAKEEHSGIHIVKKNPDGSYEGAADPRCEGVARSE